jgi:MFS family permease
MSFFVGIPLGPIFDAKGPRALSLVGALLILATYLLLSVCERYWHFFLCLGFLGSLSTYLLFTSALGTIQHWFLHRRGLATGLAISGGSFGGILFPLLLGALLPRIGFAWTMRVIALVMLPCVSISLALIHSRIYSEFPSTKRMLPNLGFVMAPRMNVLTVVAFFVELGLYIPMTDIAS